MDILEIIRKTACSVPDRPAVCTPEGSMTYGNLWKASGLLAKALLEKDGTYGGAKPPIPVYGHKSPWMLVCFLACMRAGHAYCPLDRSMPPLRVARILDILAQDPSYADGAPLPPVLSTLPFPREVQSRLVWDLETLKDLCRPSKAQGEPLWEKRGKDEDLLYIIFTSGSTGDPKGVCITHACLGNFLEWSVTLGGPWQDKLGAVFLNQAPFSFDLSVMDLYTCLASGGTLWCLTQEDQKNYARLMQSLRDSQVRIWTSTPSFAEVCLADPSFCQENLPSLSLFLFCGETLSPKTADRLLRAFPAAKIINTYGPTESTVAVTGVEITGKLCGSGQALPVGRPKPGTQILIEDTERRLVPEGTVGEIVILGNTVSPGYYLQSPKKDFPFFTDPEGRRGYHTQDAGYLQDGMLYFRGRMDFQIKLHGYRIELEDIERNLLRLPQVRQALVLANEREGKVRSLTAYLVPAPGLCPGLDRGDTPPIRDDALAGRLKESLLDLLPAYMVPKTFRFLASLPVTANGKVDRRKLKGGSA